MTKAILNAFRNWLASNQIEYQEKDFTGNLDFIRRQIKYEYILSHFGPEDAQQILLEGDPQITKALEVLPHAREIKRLSQKQDFRGETSPGRKRQLGLSMAPGDVPID